MPSALVIGGAGYIGGPTLIWFKSQYPEYEITATSRSPTTTKRLQDFGVHVVEITGLSDVQKAASEADLVINFADGTNQPHVQAITAGLRERFQSTKIRPIFIHISGSLSTWKSTTIAQSGVASDTDEATLRAIPTGNTIPDKILSVDLEVQGADAAGYLWGYIIAPPLVYGRAQTPLERSDSLVWRGTILPLILARREVAYVGDGSFTWDSIHIDDLTGLITLITRQALSGEAKSANPYDRFFFCPNGNPASWKTVMDKIAPVLHAEGLVDSPQAVSRSAEDVPQLGLLGGNMRTSADRSAALGWKPSRPSVLEGLEDEIRSALKFV